MPVIIRRPSRRDAEPRHASPSDDRPLILFDVDGTLLDSVEVIAETMIQAFAAAGEDAPGRAAIRQSIGLSLPEMVDLLAWDLAPERREKILAGYRFRYSGAVEGEEEQPLFEGARAFLERLRGTGAAMAITSGKSARSLDYMLGEMDGRHLFDTVQCADENLSKPDPCMILNAMRRAGVPAARTVLVGDTRYDMEAARRAGIRAIGVCWGYHDPQALLAGGAVAVARDFDHLGALLSEALETPAARDGGGALSS